MATIDYKMRWIYAVSFLDLFAISLLLPSMSAHLKSLGASYLMIGAMNSIYAGMQLISGPVIGSWSDQVGRREILISTYFIIGCCYSILGILNSLSIILLLRAVIGALKHGRVLIQAIVADEITVRDQAYVAGRLNSFAALSFTLGPTVGGHLMELDGGFSYICCCTGILLVINCVISYFCVTDASNFQQKPKDNQRIIERFSKIVCNLKNVKWRYFGRIFTLKFIFLMSTGVFYSNYSIKVQERFDISQKFSGYTIAYQSFVGMLTGLFVSNINEKFYKTDVNFRKRNFHSFAILLLGLLGANFASNLSAFLLFSALAKMSHIVLRINLTNMLMEKCPRSQTGSVTGAASSVSSLARLIVPLAAGFIDDMWGPSSSNLLAALVAITGVLISLKLEKVHPKDH